jgi:hypothetical protein
MSGSGNYPDVTGANEDANLFKSKFTDASVTANWTFSTAVDVAGNKCAVWKLTNDASIIVVYAVNIVDKPAPGAVAQTLYNVYFSHADAVFTTLGGALTQVNLEGAPASDADNVL